MKLYELTDQMLDFLEALERGDIPEEAINDTLEGLQGAMADKLDDCACAYKGLLAEAEAIKAEADRLSERYKHKVAEADRLKEYIDRCLRETAGDEKPGKIETARNVLRYTTSRRVNIADENAVMNALMTDGRDDLLTYKTSLNKTAIKKAIEAGDKVDGAEIVTCYNLSIK